MKRRDFLNSSLLAAAITVPGIRAAYAVVGTGQVADLAAITGDGREITLRGTDIRDLAAKMRGQLLLAGDEGYDKARLVLNPSFDKHPALIAQPSGVADVQAAVAFARANNLLVAVKCGGHSASGQSSCDRGMQIDLSKFRGVRVDPRARRAWVEGGTLLGEVDHECMAHGLVAPLGTVSHTGVGGLTTGGGFGRLARRFGMSIDNLESVDVVTADGQLRHASARENPDLFWGVRGGGGNFGIVDELRIPPAPDATRGGRGIRAFPDRESARTSSACMPTMSRPHPTSCTSIRSWSCRPAALLDYTLLEVCYSAVRKRMRKPRLRPFGSSARRIATPSRPRTTSKYSAPMTRAIRVRRASYLKGGFISKVPDKLVSQLVEAFEGNPGRLDASVLPALRRRRRAPAGKRHGFCAAGFHRQHDDRSAWQLSAGDPAEHIQATRKYWATLEPFTRGFYVNDMAREASSSEINSNYRGNYKRLVTIKNQYDPTNLFRLNANIQPTKT